MAKTYSNAFESFFGLEEGSRRGHILWGVVAFAVYQIALSLVVQALGITRNFSLFPVELLVFGLVVACVSLYSTAATLRNRALISGDHDLDEHRRRHSARIQAYLSKRHGALCQGIDHSLSAIMFFARAQLGRRASPQLDRDIREVMERIEQVQLLVSEMQRSVENLASLENSDELLAAAKDLGPPATVTAPEPADEYKGASGLYSLRKTARKALVLPITVSYTSEENQLQFHTYTVNLCEEGACIVFTGNHVGSLSEIGVQMPEEFATRAKIRWIQPAREESFRLAGIEFLGQRAKVASLQ